MKKKNIIILIVLLLIIIINCFFNYKNKEFFDNNFSICYITAIYGNYESTCKPFVNQTIKSDFICFTDNSNIENNGWTIDTTPYHIINKSKLDDNTYVNSLSNNKHTFNIAKYYKQQFQNIPILSHYDVIVWLDGTIKITNENVSEYIKKNIEKYKIIGWMHENSSGILKNEVDASNFERYTSTFWNNQTQPYQDIFKQYETYVNDGYDDHFFDNAITNEFNKDNAGVWITCFVAFLNKNKNVTEFLDLWYLQTLEYTTQDQISFSYVCYKTKIIPYTLPDENVKGVSPHLVTDFYEKMAHSK